jgi:hypothetical protein
MAFVRGDRVGLIRLQRVLPNIFKAFPGCDPHDVLVECNLRPTSACDGGFTFFFRPERDGEDMVQPPRFHQRGKRHQDDGEVMIQPKRHHDEPPACEEETRVVVYRKTAESYSELRSSWRS